MAWFTREKTGMDEGSAEGEKRLRTEGLWLKCESCSQIIWKKALDENLQCCPKCDFHFRVDARTRLGMLFDGEFEEFDAGMTSCDPLHLDEAYGAKLATARETTKLSDALLSASGSLDGRRVNICAMEWKFMGGSMGAVVGEKITRAVERSVKSRAPLVIISASGGARMQEGTISLMQLAKISAALMHLDEAKVPYVSVLTDPTSGGVTASFAMLGDVILAEPGALICFTGPRVIEQFMHVKPPEVNAEFVLQHGMIDAVVHRRDLRQTLARLMQLYTPGIVQRNSQEFAQQIRESDGLRPGI
jgi:acetyl-CoA carboxylase carboxyl transferase subunit beta